MKLLICALFSWTLFDSTLAATCVGTVTIGQPDVFLASVSSPDPRDLNSSLLMTGSMFTVPCCGILQRWRMVVEGVGQTWAQIWRPVPGQSDNYTYLGGNRVRSTSTAISGKTKRINQRFRVEVVPGDVVGLFLENSYITRYTTCDPAVNSLCEHEVYYKYTEAQPDVGDVLTFDVIQSDVYSFTGVRGYAFAADIIPKDAASCTDRSVTISDTLGVGDLVATIRTDFVDLEHPNSSISIDSTDPVLPIVIDPYTAEVTLSGPVSPAYPSSTGSATIRVRDVCGDEATCVLTVTITNDPKDIIFTNLPASISIEKTLSASSTVYILSTTSQRDVDVVTCTVDSSTASIDWFQLRNISKTEFEVYPSSSLTIGEDNDPVALLISCSHTGGSTNQSLLVMTLTKDDSSTNTSLIILIAVLAGVFLLAAVLTATACLIRKGCMRPSGPPPRKVQKNMSSPRPVKMQKVIPMTHFPPNESARPPPEIQAAVNTASTPATPNRNSTDKQPDKEISSIGNESLNSQANNNNDGICDDTTNEGGGSTQSISAISTIKTTSILASSEVQSRAFMDLSDIKSPAEIWASSPVMALPASKSEWTLSATNLSQSDKVMAPTPRAMCMSPVS